MRRDIISIPALNATVRFKFFLLCLLWSWLPIQSAVGQCTIEAPTCQSATPLCGFYQEFRLPYQNGFTEPFPGCLGGFALHNPIWFSFVPESPQLVLNVSPFSCFNGAGYQVGVYDSCDPGGSFPLFVQCACTTGPTTITGPFIPGETYYMVVDGCNGDICDIAISVVQGQLQDCGPILQRPSPPFPDQFYPCPGQIITFMTDAVPGALFYDWSFPSGVIPLNIECTIATVIWGTQSGNVTVTASDANGNSLTSDPTFIDVLELTGNASGSYCFPQDPGYFYPPAGTFYPAGVWDVLFFTANGCDSVVTLEVEEYISLPETVFFDICDGDTLTINGEIFTATGSYQQTLSGATSDGCDSLLTIEINSGAFSFASPSVTDASCGLCNGEIDLQVSCAQMPLNIVWNNNLPNSTLNPTDLCPGTYTVTVTDASGASISTTIDVEGVPGLNIQADLSSVTCAGATDGSASINIMGGVPGYTIDWSDDSLDGQTMATGLASGTYGLTVTDAAGCTGTIDLIITEPAPLAIQLETQQIRCDESGRVRATVTGGTPPYSYLWSNGVGIRTISNLGAGDYFLTVTDANDCSANVSVSITSPFITVDDTLNTFEVGLADADTLGCGQIRDTIFINNYPSGSYAWTTADGSILENQDTFIIINTPGTYIVQISVTDETGENCIAEDSIVIARECCPIDFVVQSQNETCQGIGDGRARVVIAGGGTPPFMFQWSDPNLPQEQEVTNLPPGAYTVTLTDATGCSYTSDFEITSFLDLMATTTPADCDGTGGSATAFASGFFISYFWSNGGAGPTQTNLAVGEYTVTAWSIFGGCQSAQTILIEVDSSCNDVLAERVWVDESTLSWDESTARNGAVKTSIAEMTLQLSPNPISDLAYLDLNLSRSQLVDLRVYSAEGKVLQEKKQQINQGGDQIILSFKTYPPGIYYLRVQTSDGQVKMIKGIKI